MVWKTTLALLVAVISLNSGYANTELTLSKDFSYSRPSSEVDLLSSSNVTAAEEDCVINLENCPADIFVPCRDGGTTVTWTPPQFSYTCTTSTPGEESSFYVEFNLPESKNTCWEYNYVQRIGSNNLRLFQSTGVGTETYFTIPLQYFNNSDGGTKINMDLIVPDGKFDWTLDVLNSNNVVIYSASVTNINSTGSQLITIPSTVANGVYKLRFKFSNLSGPNGTAREVDRIYYNATNVDKDCLEGVNFVVTSNYNPGDFFNPGTTRVIYTATYTAPNKTPLTKTCEFNVNIAETPAIPVVVSTTQPTCTVGTGSFSITAVDDMTYSFNDGAFGNTTSWSELAADTYTVVAKNTDGCVSSELFVTINSQPTAPTAEAGNTAELTCSVQTLQLNGSSTGQGTLSYAWTTTDGTIDSGANTITPIVSAAGTYTLTVTNDDNGCFATDTVIITQDNSKPAAAIANNNGLDLSCSNPSTTLTASGGGSYIWSNGETTASITVTTTGTFTVTVTGENGCTSTASVTTTLDNSVPAAAIVNNNGLDLNCSNPSTTLTASGGVSYLWSNGATTASITVTTADTFTVTVTGENGCTATASATTTLDNSVPVAAIANNNGLDLNCSNPSTTLTASGGVSYLWSNGATTASITVTTADTFTVTVTGANGCTATASATTTLDNSVPVAAIANNNGLDLNCSNPSTTLTASGGVSYLWSNGATTASITVTTADTFTVTVTGENGCTATASATTTLDNSVPVAAIASNNGLDLNCSNPSTTLTASGGLSYLWSTGATTASITVTTADTFTVTVTGANGCTATASVTTTLDNSVPAAAIANNNGLALSCSNPSTTLTASGGLSYLWSTGATTASITVTTADTFTVTVTSANGCTATASVTTTLDNNVPTAAIADNNGLALSCNVPSTTLTASGGVSYLWSTGETTASINVETVGTFTVTVTGENGCTANDSVTTTLDNTVPTAAIADNNGLALSCNVPSITLTASGGVSYLWSNGATTASINVETAGTFTVTVTGENGCTDEASVTVEQNITPADAIITGNDILTCELTSITLNAATSTADGTASYLWNDGSTEATLTVTAPGIYSVTVTGENGCSDEASITVEQNITPADAVITGNDILTCELTSVTLDASSSTADGDFTYLWSNGATTASINVTEAGTYTVTVTGENGCFDEASVTVEKNDTTADAVITGNEILDCNTTSITLDASTSTADGNFTYLWNDGSAEATLTVTAPGIYSVTVTGENGCSDEASVTVEQNITPADAVITGNDILTCELTFITLNAATSTADGTASYLWNDGSTEATLTVTVSGIYSVTVTGENGCSDEASVTVEQNITPANAVITGNDILTCELTSVTLDASSSTADGDFTYLWSNGATTASINVTEAGTYTVTISGENGCSDEASVTVEKNDTTANAVITGNDILTCELTSITLNAGSSTADGNFTYLWNDGSTGATLTVTAPGIYSVTVTGENGCTDEASVTVEQNITPADAVITGNDILTCELTSITLNAATSTADGTASYLWNDGSTEATLTVTAPGIYSVTVTGENGCSDEASATVEQNITPADAIITGNDILTCELTSITLNAATSTADGTASYLWNDGSTEATLTVTAPGIYSVTVTGENGCSDEASITVEQNITPADAVITGNDILTCELTSVTLDASSSTADGDFTYLWSNGATTASINVTEAGTYTVTVTGENGCFDEASVTVEKNDTTADAVITGNEILDCNTTSITLDASTSTADGNFTYLWSDGSTGVTLTVTAPGIYSVTVTGENGCSDEASVTVEQNITPADAVITGNDILTCELTSITLNAATSTADGTASYLWNDGSTEATLTVTAPGIYSVTVTGENGCSDEASITVEQNITPADAVITGNDILTCELTSVTLDASSSTADGDFTYLWSNGATTASINVTEAGTYTVTITGENGCSDEASVTVEKNDTTADAVITGNEILDCNTTSITLNASTSTADGNFTYLWSDGSTGATLTVTEAGLYSVIITGENGCSDEASETVVFVPDTEDPEVDTLKDISVNVDSRNCSAIVEYTLPTATDNCSGAVVTLDEGSLSSGSAFPVGTTTVNYTATDASGNTTSVSFTVTVIDNEAPVADIAELPTVTGECSATVSVVPTATDNCGGTINGTTEDALTYTEQGTYTVTWTFNDGNGNTSTQTQTVIVDDVTAPVADVAELQTVTGECSATVSVVPTATDNCGGTINGTTEDALTYTEQGTYTVTWTFNDGNGNTSSQIQTVIVDDVTAPVADVAELPNVTGECSAIVSVVPTASDNCGGTINGTTEDALTYTEQGTYTVTWTFNDGNGNTSTQTQTVIVDDVTAPVADVAELPNVTGECSATVSVVPTATDNCGGTINGTTEDALTYTEQGTYTVTWTFNDGNGNTSTQTQTVIVDDVTAPVADEAELPTVTGECSATVSVVPTATDNCGGTINGTTEDALTYTEQGTYTVTWTFDDGNGNTSTQTQTVIVDDVTAPVTDVADLPTVTGECSATVSVVPTATDNCGGTINGTTEDALTYTEQGTYTVTWTFNDGNGNTSTQTQTVIVDDVTAPVADVAELPTVTGECSATVSVVPTATDNCGGTINGTTEDALTYTEQGTYTVTWTFDEGNGNTSSQNQTVIVEDITAPIAVVAELPTVTGECSATISVVPTATDNCGGTINGTTEDALTYTEQGTYTVTWTFNDGNGNTSTQTQTVIVDDVTAPVADVAELPTVTGECSATVSVVPTATDNCGGTINGTTEDALTYTEQGTYTVTWTFDDGNGNTSSQNQTVIVEDITAPIAVVAELPTVTGECSATISVVPTATDNCGGTINGTTEDALTYTEQGTYTVTWTFDDGNGNTSSQNQTVIVEDITAPIAVVAELPTVTGECSATVSVVPTATDNCGGTINGTTEDALTYTEQGTYTVTWTFNDGNGNTSTQTQTVIVEDITAPIAVVAELPTVTGECSATVSVVPTATDNCGGTINGTTEDALTYTEQGTYTVTWTFDDGKGNTSTQTQTVIVDDVTSPVAITIADATGECEVTVTAPTTSDNCSGTITGTTLDPLTYNEQGSYEVTWTFDDGNGNVTTAVQEVIVNGISAPVVSAVIQPNCEVATGSFTVTTIDGLEYTIDGENFTTSGNFDNLDPGVYTVAAMNEAGCMSPLTEVIINETTSLTAPAIATTVQPTCEITTGSFTVAGEEGISYSIDGTNYQAGVEFSNLAPGTYNVTAQNEAGCISAATVVIIEESAVAEPIGDKTVNLCDENYDLFDLYENIDETGVWEDTELTGALTGSTINPNVLEVGTYSFKYVTGGDCPSTTTVIVTKDCVVLDCDFESIKNGISKVVTPGTDTYNDFFVVDEERLCGFTYGIQIFNRWGAEVYSNRDYDNDWNGYSNKSFTGSNQLPSGTYFYIIQIDGESFEPIQGYIYLGTK